MRTVVAYTGNMAHAQNAALALFEAGSLDAFVTTATWNPQGCAARLLGSIPGTLARHTATQLERRKVELIPPGLVHSYPAREVVRTLASRFANEPVGDFCWDWMACGFDNLVARRYVAKTQAIQAFEYSALTSFRRARERGVARILHLPSLDSRSFREIERRERSIWPELIGQYDGYFEAAFERRYARRCAEIELADVIIANSPLTMRSHIKAGADPQKIFPVLLGAPRAVASSELRPGSTHGALRCVWAGPFSLRKGAHYMLAAWQKLAAGKTARLDVYGRELLPERLRAADDPTIVFHGSVSQRELFAAFLNADVLVFPTLSDGFGMVVAEAFAHGLPVITTLEAGSAALVGPDNGLTVPAANIDALTDALRWCLDNRQQLQEMRFGALAAARDQQWTHFRLNLIAALTTGLTRRGYQPMYSPLA